MKAIIIGCPGSGKSTFARELNRITQIPLFYLDMIFHRADQTTCSSEEFDEKLGLILREKEWVIDGNYARTLPVRLQACDTVYWLRYPLEVCLEGIKARRGKPRIDMPWVETEPDQEFLDFVKSFHTDYEPEMEKMLEQTKGKEIYVFSSRAEAAGYLKELENCMSAGVEEKIMEFFQAL